MWRSESPGAIHQNHVFAVRVDQARLSSDCLAYTTESTAARDYFEMTGNRAVTGEYDVSCADGSQVPSRFHR